LAALVSKEVAEVRKQKFTRGVFPLLLLGMILLLFLAAREAIALRCG